MRIVPSSAKNVVVIVSSIIVMIVITSVFLIIVLVIIVRILLVRLVLPLHHITRVLGVVFISYCRFACDCSYLLFWLLLLFLLLLSCL